LHKCRSRPRIAAYPSERSRPSGSVPGCCRHSLQDRLRIIQNSAGLRLHVVFHQAPRLQAPRLQAPRLQAPRLQAPQLQAPRLQAPGEAGRG
jgi:hypothetical protein